MDKKNITGIQQIGVGVADVHVAWKWYRQNFGIDIGVFEEEAIAELMLPYTEGKKRARHAVLAYNMQSGGGFEVWQHTGKKPAKPVFEVQLGDIGIFIAKVKSKSPKKAFDVMNAKNLNLLGAVVNSPSSSPHFFIKDPFDNIFQIVEDDYIFEETNSVTGGIFGAIIGVSNLDESLKLYQDILGYDTVVYDETGVFEDFKGLPGGERKVRRVLLKHAAKRSGGFAPLLGPSEIELVQLIDEKGKDIYKDRIWGDLGFIHLCFDTIGMDLLKEEAKEKGFPFTVDSAESFDMGAAAGRFAYVSDPDGIPIEFVETHKVPIIKKIGWNINLEKRDPKKSLPKWMIGTLRWKRVKD
ncbi:MAG: VOC family protein [Flavobacteriaceae bacterium]|nr:VOC family protein [Flavobacteriaceae bacterium]